MSADNWAVCPVCDERRRIKFGQREQEVKDAYGKVMIEEFDRLREELDLDQAKTLEPTFREDYEFYGAADGVVTATYHGHCDVCKADLKFEHDHTIEDPGKGDR